LLVLDGDCLRRRPLADRKEALRKLLESTPPNSSKRRWAGGHRLQEDHVALSIGPDPVWIKVKNKAAPAYERRQLLTCWPGISIRRGCRGCASSGGWKDCTRWR